MSVFYIDEFGFLAGEIAEESVCAANSSKCISYPIPPDALPAWKNWHWGGAAWQQGMDNRGRTWYCTDKTDTLFHAMLPQDVPPSGYAELIPGQDKVVSQSEALSTSQALNWAAIKGARDAALHAPLATPYGVFDAYPDASANIIKSVLLANNLTALGYPAAIDFTLYDNTVVVLDATGMVQVGLALAGREQQIRAKATGLRALIEAATTLDQLTAVVW